jgi:hypothetical protein
MPTPRNQLTQFPIAHDQDAIVRANGDLFLDLERGCHRFDEGGSVGRNLVGHHMQVGRRQREILGERAIPIHDSQHGAPLAVRGTPLSTGAAIAAHRVDLTHHAFAREVVRSVVYYPNELVAEDSFIWVIATSQLDIGVADTGLEHTHQYLAVWWRWYQNVVPNAKRAVLQPDCLQMPSGRF